MIGIDISANSIKLVELDRAGEFFRVKKAGIAYLEPVPDASKEEIQSRQEKAIQELKESFQIKDKTPVVVSLPSNAIFVRYLDILKSQKKKEDDFVKFEAKQQIPFPLEEVAWDYFFLNPKSGGGKQAVLMAVKNDLMEESLHLIRSSNLKVKSVNLGLVNLLNIGFLNISFKRNEMGILVDIGSDSSGVIISKKGDLWLRSVSTGGNAITQEIANALGVNYKQADLIKRQGPSELEKKDEQQAQTVRDIVISNLVTLSGEIERSIQFFNSEQEKKGEEPDGDVEPKIILTGGVCSMDGVDGFFSDKLNISTSTLNIERKIQIPEEVMGEIRVLGAEDFSVTEKNFPFYFGIATGAALSGIGKEEFKINFLKHKVDSPGSKKPSSFFSLLSKIFIVLAAVVYFAFLYLGLQVNKSRLETTDQIMSKFDQFRDQIIQIEKNQKTAKDEADFFVNFASKRYLWIDIMNELTKIIPLNIWIEEWHSQADTTGGGKDSLVLKGYMLSYDDFNEFIGNVKSLPMIGEVTPESIETGEGQFYFTLNISLTPQLPVPGGE